MHKLTDAVCVRVMGWKHVQLSSFVSAQRQEYKLHQEGRPSRLTSERIKKLDEIGFVWEVPRGGPRRKKYSGPKACHAHPFSHDQEGGYTVPVHRLQDRR